LYLQELQWTAESRDQGNCIDIDSLGLVQAPANPLDLLPKGTERNRASLCMSAHIAPIGLLAIPVFLFSLVVHEVSHAWMAMKGGDLTATYQGRLSFNPLVHLDPIGTLMILLGALSGLPLIGWARPVPVNMLRFRNSRWIVWVSLAGPGSNLVLVLAAGLLSRLSMAAGFPAGGTQLGSLYYLLLFLFVFANVCLMLFNLIPIPPLDGSKVFFQLFVKRRNRLYDVFVFLERYGFILLVILFVASPLRIVFADVAAALTEAIVGPQVISVLVRYA